jgi:hypothetical protein
VPFTERVHATSQVRSPWKATGRTIFAGAVTFAALAPAIAVELGVDKVSWVAGFLVILGAITRVLALPSVEAFLRQYVPWLAAGATDEIEPEVNPLARPFTE